MSQTASARTWGGDRDRAAWVLGGPREGVRQGWTGATVRGPLAQVSGAPRGARFTERTGSGPENRAAGRPAGGRRVDLPRGEPTTTAKKKIMKKADFCAGGRQGAVGAQGRGGGSRPRPRPGQGRVPGTGSLAVGDTGLWRAAMTPLRTFPVTPALTEVTLTSVSPSAKPLLKSSRRHASPRARSREGSVAGTPVTCLLLPPLRPPSQQQAGDKQQSVSTE